MPINRMMSFHSNRWFVNITKQYYTQYNISRI